MGVDSVLYQIIYLLHILAAIVAFGGFIAHGAYNADAFKGKASDAISVLGATSRVTNVAMMGLYAVFLLGIVLIPLSDEAHTFAKPWISAAFVVWFAMVGISHAMVKKAIGSLTEAATAAAPDSLLSENDGAMAAAKKLATGEGLIQLLLVVALVLMVFQPGG